jgi:hypothetical protein
LLPASEGVASEGRVDVAVRQHNGAGLERRNDVAFGAIREVGLEPLIKEQELRRLAASVRAFDDKQSAGIPVMAVRNQERDLSELCYRDVKRPPSR